MKMNNINKFIATVLWAFVMFILASKDVDIIVSGKYDIKAQKED